jgi:hypothetical protein
MTRRAFDPFAPHDGPDLEAKPASKSKASAKRKPASKSKASAKRKPASKSKETPMFPVSRLRSAGATDAEVAQLEAEHNAASREAQESRLAHLEKIAEGDIVEWLEDLRKAEEPAESQESAEVETVGASDDKEAAAEAAAETEGAIEAKTKPARKTATQKAEEPAKAAE